MEPAPVKDPRLESLWTDISCLLDVLNPAIGEHKPPIVQELVLAQRHLQDARMRIAVARTYLRDEDPWTNVPR